MTLTVTNLSFERQFITVFSQLNFTLAPGELLQIRGENGSGKSTLLRILAGFIDAPPSTIQWNYQCITDCLAEYQQQLHYIGHQNGIKHHLTVYENILFYSALGNASTTDYSSILTKMGIAKRLHTPAHDLSAGQLRRLSLARLVLSERPLWILDEPLSALDQSGQFILGNLLNEHLAAKGMAIVATHHDLPLALSSLKTLTLERA